MKMKKTLSSLQSPFTCIKSRRCLFCCQKFNYYFSCFFRFDFVTFPFAFFCNDHIDNYMSLTVVSLVPEQKVLLAGHHNN